MKAPLSQLLGCLINLFYREKTAAKAGNFFCLWFTSYVVAGWRRAGEDCYLAKTTSQYPLKLPRERIFTSFQSDMKCGLGSAWFAKLVSVNWKCFQFKPFSTTKSLALNFEGRAQISQELKALKIAPRSLFKKGETWIVFWICEVINLRIDAPSPLRSLTSDGSPWWLSWLTFLNYWNSSQSVWVQADVFLGN